jgi:hypothetical protein
MYVVVGSKPLLERTSDERLTRRTIADEEERREEEGTVARPSMAAAHQGGGFSFASSSSLPAGQFALSSEAGGLTEPGWLRHLGPEFAKVRRFFHTHAISVLRQSHYVCCVLCVCVCGCQPYFRSLMESVAAERQAHTVYPPEESVYRAFNYTPLDQVRSLLPAPLSGASC